MTYLKVRKIFKEGTDNLTPDKRNGQKGLTDVIRAVKKGRTKYKEIMIDTKKVEIQPCKTIKERWDLDEEGENKGLRETAFRYWKTGFLSPRLQNFSLLHINNRYKYNNQRSKYKKDKDNLAVSNRCTICKLIDPDTIQVESRVFLPFLTLTRALY